MEAGNTEGSPAVVRLLRMLLKRDGCFCEENFQMCIEMVYVGLNADFFGEGGKVDKPEIKFVIKNKDPEYEIMGFIDKKIKFKDKIKVVDYKSSKRKFSSKDLAANVQAMTYTLASKRKWPKSAKNVEMEFVFLRFPKQPLQQIVISEEQLKGFEHYLAFIYKKINEFTEEDARSNFASDKQETKFFCKAGQHWKCPYLLPFDYYVVENNDGKILRSAHTKEELGEIKKGEVLVEKKYEGCPAHPNEASKQDEPEDPCDWI